MGLFGAIVRTVVNVAILPVTLPMAVCKDAIRTMEGEQDVTANTREVVKQIKREASEDR